MRTSAFFGTKDFGYSEIYDIFSQIIEGGFNQCGHFANKRRGVNFSQFYVDIVYERPLLVFNLKLSDQDYKNYLPQV